MPLQLPLHARENHAQWHLRPPARNTTRLTATPSNNRRGRRETHPQWHGPASSTNTSRLTPMPSTPLRPPVPTTAPYTPPPPAGKPRPVAFACASQKAHQTNCHAVQPSPWAAENHAQWDWLRQLDLRLCWLSQRVGYLRTLGSTTPYATSRTM